MIYIPIFDCIIMSKNLINSFIDYIYFIILQKNTNKMIINLITKEFTICINIIKRFTI